RPRDQEPDYLNLSRIASMPGHRGYIFTILVGKHRRGLIQRFDPAHQHLTKTIPCIDAMRDKFK
ncbi:hypothetical protein ACC731_38105, partial [Rhizobium ruizarguesonis]